MKTLLKLPFKILALPFVPALFIAGMALTFLGWLSGRLLTVVTLILGVGGVIMLCQGDLFNGAVTLVMAFLVSPLGIPAIAEGIADVFHSMNGSIIGFIAG